MRRFRWLVRWLAAALMAAGVVPAWGNDAQTPAVGICRSAAQASPIDATACLESALRRLDARLHGLLEQRARAVSDTTVAEHDRWHRAATTFCTGIAATEPMPTYEASLLDCAVSVLADRVASLESERLSSAETPGTSDSPRR